jgi:hypothetical protein
MVVWVIGLPVPQTKVLMIQGLIPLKTEDEWEEALESKGFILKRPSQLVIGKGREIACKKCGDARWVRFEYVAVLGCRECARRAKEGEFLSMLRECGLTPTDPGWRYENNRTKCAVRCEAGHEFETTLTYQANMRGCKMCNRGATEALALMGTKGIRFSDPGDAYVSTRQEHLVTCEQCGHEWTTCFYRLKKFGCPGCAGNVRKTREEWEALLARAEFEFLALDQPLPKNRLTKFPVKCLVCGRDTEISGQTLTKSAQKTGRGCPECVRTHREDFLKALGERGYSPVDPDFAYESARTPVLVQGPCGHMPWATNLHRLTVLDQGCPQCLHKREALVGELLRSKYGEVRTQVRVPCPTWVRKSGKVVVDFYVPSKGLYVEYHGEQHFRYMPELFHKKGRGQFESQRARDEWVRGNLRPNLELTHEHSDRDLEALIREAKS